MATNVTVMGSQNAAVTLAFNSAANTAAAQNALAVVSRFVNAGAMSQFTDPGGRSTVPAADYLGGVVTSSPGGHDLGQLPNSYISLVNTATSGVVRATGSAARNVSAFSGTGQLVYTNRSDSGAVFLGGGNNVISNYDNAAKMVVNVDGDATAHSGTTLVDGSRGAATVRAFDGANINLITGGSVLVQAQAGTENIAVSGSSTTAASIAAVAGANVHYTPAGGLAIINPGAGNITINAGSGRESLFGGPGTFDGVNYNHASFTGSAVVFGGRGFFQGGLAGNNYLTTSTDAGQTTLKGSAGGDYLATYAGGNQLIAGAGVETLISFTREGEAGTQFHTGTGLTYLYSSAGGGDSIGLGSGQSMIFEASGVTPSASTFYIEAGGGTHTVSDFLPGSDVVSLAGSAGRPAISSLHYYSDGGSSPFAAAGTEVVLSDNTKIDFLAVNVGRSSFV